MAAGAPDENEYKFGVTTGSDVLAVHADNDAAQRIDSLAQNASGRRDLLLDQVLDGKYKIIELVGRGGNGAVYRAEHLGMGRDVAIKVLNPQSDEQSERRFQQEAQAAFNLRHENIASVHDAGHTPQQLPYIVMDYVGGPSLSTVIKSGGPLSLSRAANIVEQACAALQAAHRQGIVHRDIKPSNIIFVNSSTDRIKIVDFGIAKDMTSDRTFTNTGQIVGSPPYMSPEQCQGFRVDERSDIYSLACVLVEALTGKTVFRADNAVAYLVHHASMEPPRLSELNSSTRYSDALEAVVRHALAKDPDRRYQSIEDFAQDIDAAVHGRAVTVSTKTMRSQSGTGSRRGSLATPGVRIGLAIAFAVVSVAAMVVPSLIRAFAGADSPPAQPNCTGPTREQPIGSGDPIADAQRLDKLSLRYFNAGEYEKAIPLLEFGIKTYKEDSMRLGKGGEDVYLADNYQHIGKCYLKLNSADKAVPYYRDALRIYQKFGNYKGGGMSEAVNDYATVLSVLGRKNVASDMLADFKQNGRLTEIP